MTPFGGINPYTPAAQPAGFGSWSTVVVVEDGDTRSAGNLSAAGKSLKNEVNFLGWRCIDVVSGGSYPPAGVTPTAAPIVMNNTWTFGGLWGSSSTTGGFGLLLSPTVVSGGTTFYLGDPIGTAGDASMVVVPGSYITALTAGSVGASIVANGVHSYLRCINGGTHYTDAASYLQMDGTSTQGGTHTKIGAGAVTGERVTTLPKNPSQSVPHALTPTDSDIWVIDPSTLWDDTTSGGITLTGNAYSLAAPPVDKNGNLMHARVTFVMHSMTMPSTKTIGILDGTVLSPFTGRLLLTISGPLPSRAGSITIRWYDPRDGNGARWMADMHDAAACVAAGWTVNN